MMLALVALIVLFDTLKRGPASVSEVALLYIKYCPLGAMALVPARVTRGEEVVDVVVPAKLAKVPLSDNVALVRLRSGPAIVLESRSISVTLPPVMLLPACPVIKALVEVSVVLAKSNSDPDNVRLDVPSSVTSEAPVLVKVVEPEPTRPNK